MCEDIGVSKRNTTRLETRTKESSGTASRRLNESHRRSESNHKKLIKLRRRGAFSKMPYLELLCWDPKDGELCRSRAKPEETLVEARSGADVQIARRTRV